MKPTEKTHNLCGFRFIRKREIKRLKRKIRVERDKPKFVTRKREKKKLVELQGRKRNASQSRERNRGACMRDFKNSTMFEGI